MLTNPMMFRNEYDILYWKREVVSSRHSVWDVADMMTAGGYRAYLLWFMPVVLLVLILFEPGYRYFYKSEHKDSTELSFV